MPLRAITTGIQATSALSDAMVHTATAATQTAWTVASAALDIATIPIWKGAKVIASSTPTRRCWSGDGRAWIEVRGLNAPDGPKRGRVVLDALQAHPDVTSASLNRPLSRVVVEIESDRTTLRDLCSIVGDAETRCGEVALDGTRDSCDPRGNLPGDGLLLATRVALVGANAAGLGIAVVGRALRLPRAPITVEAVAAIANYQPRLRRLLEDRIGSAATETVLSMATTAAYVATLSPPSLAVELMMQALKAAECRAEAQAWGRREPALARYAEDENAPRPSRPVPPPAGSVERHARRIAFVQAIGTGLVGAIARNVEMASTATVAAAPKAMYTACESFAATLGRGLADHYSVLPLRPDSLRRLDKVDALLIDPRALCSEKLRVVRVRGAHDDQLSAAWNRAQELLHQPGLGPGWHPVSGVPARRPGRNGAVEALILPAHHPLASAVVAEGRGSGAKMVSVDVDIIGELGELRPAFDEIRPVHDGTIDEALADALADLQQAGHTVAVLSSPGAQPLSSADVALGIWSNDGTSPPWDADLMLADLTGAWQVLHSLPAAREASRRGIAISAGASALGALLMVPGVRGRGPGPVAIGAAAGLLSGYLLARGAIRSATPRPAPAYEWHAMSVQQVREVLPPPGPEAESSVPTAARRGAELSARIPKTVWQFANAVRAELSDPLTPVLALGSVATAMLGSPIDAVMVGAVLTGNSMLAAAQRLRAESRLNRLLAQQIPPAHKVAVGPDGKRSYSKVVAERLQPGDVIEVRSNEVVPADARLIVVEDLEVDESSLTGESLPVGKQVEATPGAELAERRCMLYAGAHVVAGTGIALVTAVGADTQERRAAELASGDLPTVGLQHQLSQLTKRAFPITASGGAVISALGLLRRGDLRRALASGIAVAVAAVPEGMPLVATLAQQASARRLSNFGALVRVPRSVEALGRVDVVCFDKTGTLSENRLRVARVHPSEGYSREDVLRCAAHAVPAPNGAPHAHATDRAIVEAALSVNGSSPQPEPDTHLPFRSGRSFSASVSGAELTVKGAPEVVLAACQDVGAEMEHTVHQLAAEGLRVITVARRRLNAQQVQSVQHDPERIVELCATGLSLAGFLGLSDTPRPQAPQLLADLADRDVAIRLITGDHPVTAVAIAKELGLPVAGDQVITGSEWNALSRKDQERVVAERVIFARMSPENKVQIVQTLERVGRICAMVGDGSNDAAAIRAATVGVGVVAHGSDPAHTVADVVLTDGRIESLLHAVEEGRRLWRRVQAAVSVLLGGNASQVIFAIVGSAVTGDSPLNARQLLLMNVFTDALPAAALAVSMPSGPVRRAGRGPDERMLWRAVGIRGGTTAAAATAAWAMAMVTGRRERAATVALIALVAAQLGQTLVESHDPLVLFTAAGSLAAFMAMISIPGVSQLLGCTPVGPFGWAQGLGSAAIATVAMAAATRLAAGRRASRSAAPLIDSPADRQSRDSDPESSRRQRATAAHKPTATASIPAAASL
ncbi:MAG TPA: cation-translocating P-type ATPase [Mycobacterium sp.]|uniref:cation-translocating P-type ATPase n=1 Tax=Mycobacterium sp. TaxID=1785 RepID=UPI002D5E38B9|nr:cation-translocating P-type ATPase [Mycobacterium sp.]HZU47339.1 cation-translocating P-type ATPase [Mycobacterium sp.]